MPKRRDVADEEVEDELDTEDEEFIAREEGAHTRRRPRTYAKKSMSTRVAPAREMAMAQAMAAKDVLQDGVQDLQDRVKDRDSTCCVWCRMLVRVVAALLVTYLVLLFLDESYNLEVCWNSSPRQMAPGDEASYSSGSDSTDDELRAAGGLAGLALSSRSCTELAVRNHTLEAAAAVAQQVEKDVPALLNATQSAVQMASDTFGFSGAEE